MENDTIDETLLELRKQTLARLLDTHVDYIHEMFLCDYTFNNYILFAYGHTMYWMLLSDQIHMLQQHENHQYVGEHEGFHVFKRPLNNWDGCTTLGLRTEKTLFSNKM